MEFRFKIDSDRKMFERYAVHLQKDLRSMTFDGFSQDGNESIDLILNLPVGRNQFIYKDHQIIFDLIEYPEIKSLSEETSKHQELYFSVLTDSLDNAKEILKQYINDAIIFCRDNKKEYTRISVYRTGSGWTFLSDLWKRNMNTIYLEQKEKENIINDIKKFYKSEQKYFKYGIPYKRIYLFEGLPGSGKTSLIFAIASMFNKNINLINFNQNLDDATLMRAMNNMLNDNILVLEDIDKIFNSNNENIESHTSNVTFSGFLNVLDGFGRKDKTLIFMTTNNIDKINTILKRPCRIDYILSFSYPSKNQIYDMFISFFPDQIKKFDEFYKFINNKKVTIALLQKFFFDNLDCSDIIDKLEELKSLIDYYDNTNSNLYI